MREVLVGRNISTGNGTELSEGDWNDFCLREVWADPIAIYKGFKEAQPARCNLDANYFGTCIYWSDKFEGADKGCIIELRVLIARVHAYENVKLN